MIPETPQEDGFPQGRPSDMQGVLLTPPTDPKPATSPGQPWQPPTAEELAKLLPQYEITRMLGRGGMGAVYQGTQKSLDRTVAIKILSSEMDEADASFAERFKNEARAMAKLSHPGIVAVHDSGETANGLLYIVMEFIEGTDVARMIAKRGRLHTEHAMAITAHVCDALAYAHERGIIHRDIKPANIMVGYDGVVKVADFGLAKMSKSGESGLTQSGMAMGTLYYMAPEALMLGTAVDHRADIYAVGVMLYQMLTGKLPQGLFELPSLQVPGLDPRYDGIIGKALREDRELRYPSTQDMRHDLDAILTQPVVKVKVEAAAEKAPAALETQARPQRPGGQPKRSPQRSAQAVPRKKFSTGLILAVLAIIAAGFFFLGGKGTKPAQATKDKPFVNTLGMKFVPVPITGGPTAGKTVIFSVWETRVQDYEVFAKEKGRKWPQPDFAQSPAHPAVNITWDDAQAFCAWLTAWEEKDGKLGASDIYRLPSDHEWSCAVGIGEREDAAEPPNEKDAKVGGEFPWGNQWPPPEKSGNYWSEELRPLLVTGKYNCGKGEPLPGYQDGYAKTAPVGEYAANRFGLYDLGGNAAEWCMDWYNNVQKDRVMRGGSWGKLGTQSLFLSSCRLLLSPRAIAISATASASSSKPPPPLWQPQPSTSLSTRRLPVRRKSSPS